MTACEDRVSTYDLGSAITLPPLVQLSQEIVMKTLLVSAISLVAALVAVPAHALVANRSVQPATATTPIVHDAKTLQIQQGCQVRGCK